MKNTNPLTTLFHHNRWANLRLLEICAGLADEQLDAELVGTFGSIRDTWQHIVSAERSYFSRISTGQPYRRPIDAPPLSFAEMSESARHTGDGLVEWATRVGAEDVVQIDWDGELRDLPKSILLTQAINHATEHRAQIMAIMTQVGVEPPELDAWAFFEQGGE
jgi:uncharacterized damage-inducible protein DinB